MNGELVQKDLVIFVSEKKLWKDLLKREKKNSHIDMPEE